MAAKRNPSNQNQLKITLLPNYLHPPTLPTYHESLFHFQNFYSFANKPSNPEMKGQPFLPSQTSTRPQLQTFVDPDFRFPFNSSSSSSSSSTATSTGTSPQYFNNYIPIPTPVIFEEDIQDSVAAAAGDDDFLVSTTIGGSFSASPPKPPKKMHRCKTAPALAVIRDLRPQTIPKPGSQSEPLLQQAALLLLVYLSLGVLIYSLNRDHFSGLETHPVVDALYFSIVTMCTIGYGDIAPSSPEAKVFAIFFVLVGFGFIHILLSGVVNYVLDLQENMILTTGIQVGVGGSGASSSSSSGGGGFSAKKYIVDVEKGRMRIRLKVGLALGVVVLSIGVGMVGLYFMEDLEWIDCFYLSVMSVTTVGYGDTAFKTLNGRLFASIWLLFSTLAVARAFLYLAEARIDKRHRRIAKWVLHREITIDDLFAADLNNNGFISKSEYIVYKLKEMGKVREKDILQICNQFSKVDPNNSGKITLPDLLAK